MTRSARVRRALTLGTLASGALAFGGGCARVQRPPATAASLGADAAVAAAAHRTTVDTVVERLARRAARRGDRTLDVLLLSGGGQNGAYGAGFLRGWAAHPEAPIPRFDLVTGVSTGALQAPFAVVGTRAAYDTLTALYRRAADEMAPRPDWLYPVRPTGGLLDTRRYERTLARVIDERMRADLLAAFAEDRQLAVATTDFDLGVGHVWDVARLLRADDSTAAARGRALAATRRVLYASTAIPGLFAPAVLPDETGRARVHVDGGVVANVLPVLDLGAYRRLAERLRAHGVVGADDGRPVTVRLWVVMNVWPHLAPRPVNPASLASIGRRGALLLHWAQQPQLLATLATLGTAVSRDVPGLRLEVRATAIPDALAAERAADRLFDRDFMARLDSLGAARALGPAPWDALPPSAYERATP